MIITYKLCGKKKIAAKLSRKIKKQNTAVDTQRRGGAQNLQN